MILTMSKVEAFMHILFISGIIVESMTGAIAAGQKKMDMFGVVTISVITALGGGTIRNMILGVYPMLWVKTPGYLVLAIVAALAAIPLVNVVIRLRRLFLILDAAGLVTFAYLGCIIGYEATQSITIATVMAIVTGVSGGVLRDILCNDIPLVFSSELYALVAFMVGLVQSILLYFHHNNVYSAIGLLVLGFLLRVWAINHKIRLPLINYQDKKYNH